MKGHGHIFILSVFLVTMASLILGAAPKLWAIPLADAEIRIEINATDGDAGIQIFLDGKGWNFCQVFDPNGTLVVTIQGSGSVGMQGITELFFESAEPSFEEQTLAELLARFPKGNYKIDCMTTDEGKLTGSAMLTHNIPAEPEVVSPEVFDSTLPVVIEWEEVTEGFDNGEGLGLQPGVIDAYEVIVEEPSGRRFDIKLPATARFVTVPPEFIQPNTEYKVEVLAIEKSGNQTITESSFKTTK